MEQLGTKRHGDGRPPRTVWYRRHEPPDHPGARGSRRHRPAHGDSSSCDVARQPARLRPPRRPGRPRPRTRRGEASRGAVARARPRRRRRSRLRVTAVPTRRPMAQPTRHTPDPCRRRNQDSHAEWSTAHGRPWRRTAAWDERPWRRLRPTAGAGPCGAGRRAPRDRLSSTCGDGTRGAWLACGCSAGRCASLTPPRPEGRRAATAADAIPCPLVLDRCTSMRSMAERPSRSRSGRSGARNEDLALSRLEGDRPGGQRAPGVLWTTAPFILIRGACAAHRGQW